jgi:Dienelactone hydrolase family
VGSAGKVGVIGYCWGGFLSWLSATRRGSAGQGLRFSRNRSSHQSNRDLKNSTMAPTKAESSSVTSPSVMRGQLNSAAATIGPELAKRLELLREIRPGAVRLAFLGPRTTRIRQRSRKLRRWRRPPWLEPVSGFRIRGVRGGVLAHD